MPLQHNVTNLNKDTLLLNSPTGTESLNSAYTIPYSERTLGHTMACCNNQPDPVGAINNVYDLPSIEPAILYPHGAAGFPTKSTWLKAIRNGNYLTCPLANMKKVNKFFPESEETQKGHMCMQLQGVQSTKATSQQAAPLSASQTGDSPPNKIANSE